LNTQDWEKPAESGRLRIAEPVSRPPDEGAAEARALREMADNAEQANDGAEARVLRSMAAQAEQAEQAEQANAKARALREMADNAEKNDAAKARMLREMADYVEHANDIRIVPARPRAANPDLLGDDDLSSNIRAKRIRV